MHCPQRFVVSASTKNSLGGETYAQNLCGGTSAYTGLRVHRYQSHSERNPLIYIGLLNCFFYRQFGESLEFKGLRAAEGNLSTKLSTEKVSFCKAHANQALSARFACSYREVPTISRPVHARP